MSMSFHLGQKAIRLGLLLLVTLILEISLTGYVFAHAGGDHHSGRASSHLSTGQSYFSDLNLSASASTTKLEAVRASNQKNSDCCCCSSQPTAMPVVAMSTKDDVWLITHDRRQLFITAFLVKSHPPLFSQLEITGSPTGQITGLTGAQREFVKTVRIIS